MSSRRAARCISDAEAAGGAAGIRGGAGRHRPDRGGCAAGRPVREGRARAAAGAGVHDPGDRADDAHARGADRGRDRRAGRGPGPSPVGSPAAAAVGARRLGLAERAVCATPGGAAGAVLASAWQEHQDGDCGAVTIGRSRPLKAGSLDGTLIRMPDTPVPHRRVEKRLLGGGLVRPCRPPWHREQRPGEAVIQREEPHARAGHRVVRGSDGSERGPVIRRVLDPQQRPVARVHVSGRDVPMVRYWPSWPPCSPAARPAPCPADLPAGPGRAPCADQAGAQRRRVPLRGPGSGPFSWPA